MRKKPSTSTSERSNEDPPAVDKQAVAKRSHRKESTCQQEVAKLTVRNPGADVKINLIKIQEAQIKQLEDECSKLKGVVHKMEKQLSHKELLYENEKRRAAERNKTLKQFRERERWMRKKTNAEGEMEIDVHEDTEDESDESYEDDREELRRHSIELEHQVKVLQEEANNEIIECYDEDNNKYTTDLRNCVHSLLSHHVATTRVSSVIEAVLKMVGKKANRLPSTTTVNNMNVERGILAQQQVAEELAQEENTTLETDESSKYGKQYGAYALRTSEGSPYVLGLRDLLTKSGHDTLATLKDILWDIDKCYYSGKNEASQNLLFHL